MQLTLPSLPWLPAFTDMARLVGLAPTVRPQITRRFFALVAGGNTREVDPPPGVVTVHCRSGEVWITHDGDPRDVVLRKDESYVADTSSRMAVHAPRGDCVLEFEVVE